MSFISSQNLANITGIQNLREVLETDNDADNLGITNTGALSGVTSSNPFVIIPPLTQGSETITTFTGVNSGSLRNFSATNLPVGTYIVFADPSITGTFSTFTGSLDRVGSSVTRIDSYIITTGSSNIQTTNKYLLSGIFVSTAGNTTPRFSFIFTGTGTATIGGGFFKWIKLA